MPGNAAEITSRKSSHAQAIIVGCFFLSGFISLVYQIVWQRMILRDLGATLPAVSISVACIMAGFGLGACLFSARSLQVKNPLLAYAVMEAAITLCGFLSAWLLSCDLGSPFSLYVNTFSHGAGLVARNMFDGHFWLRASYVGAVLLIPSMLMGATFPAVGAALAKESSNKQWQYISAYAINLLGASLGSIICGLLLLPNFGLSKTLILAACLNVVVALIIFMRCALHKNTDPGTSGVLHVGATADPDGDGSPSPSLLYMVASLAGLIGMSLEVLWTRLFCLILGSSTYAISSVVSAHLLGLAVGAICSRHYIKMAAKRAPESFAPIVVLQLLLAAWLFLDLCLIGKIPWLLSIMESSSAASFGGYVSQRMAIVFLIALVPAAITGGIFPFVLRATQVRHSGLLFGINCGGAVAGALLTGICFIPVFGRIFASGMESTIILLAILSLLCAVATSWKYVKARLAIACSAAVFAVLLILAAPPWNQALLSSGVSFLSFPQASPLSSSRFESVFENSAVNKLLFYREGLNTTVSVNENSKAGIIYLKNDGKVEAALPLNKSLAGSDLATHVLLAQLPQVFHAAPPANVFVVGLGSGATCGAALQNTEVEHLRIAEIEPTVYDAQRFFQSVNGDPLRMPWRQSGRVLACSDDARTLLQFSDTKYDIIVCQPAEPWISGSADLYSREFWKLGRDRLQDGGVFCQWIQLYSINEECLGVLCRTFQTIFPQTYIVHYPGAGEIILVGLSRSTTLDLVKQNWRRLGGKLPFLNQFLPSEKSLVDCIVLTPEQLSGSCDLLAGRFSSRLNTDDNLLSEYILPAQLYSFADSIETNLRALGVKHRAADMTGQSGQPRRP